MERVSQNLTISTDMNNKEEDFFLAHTFTPHNKLSAIVLAQLSLEHYIPLFQQAGIDLDQFLTMTENDFIKLGLRNPRDLDLLSTCSKALSLHIQQQKQKQKHYSYQTIEEEEEGDDDMMEEEEDFLSMYSRLSNRSASTSSDDIALMTPSSITKAINAFDSYHSEKKNKTLLPASPSSPPEIVVIPSIQTNTSPGVTISSSSSSAAGLQQALASSSTVSLIGPAGTVIPRPPKNNKQLLNSNNNNSSVATLRPLSMPIQLPSFITPPPDYFTTTTTTSVFGRRLDRCKSMIIPREEEGKEELPGYSCTVFKMGYVYVKKELDNPTTKSRYRAWRKLYIELWGTMLRIYRAAPTKTFSSNIDHHNYYKWPLRAPYYYYHKYYYTPIYTISLAGAEATRALDYSRRPNALRLTTHEGPQLLLRLSSHVEMISWIEHLQAAINISLDLEQRPMPKFITIPSRGLANGTLDARSIEIERAREQRRRDQQEVLI